MSSEAIKYITYEEVLAVYGKTIRFSGGGLCGIKNPGRIKSFLDFVQNDDYYPDFVSKLNYLVFKFCSGHCFDDGNKRIALTMGVYFLHKNNHILVAITFMKRLEAIIYHIAAGHIDYELSYRIMECIVSGLDFDEVLKIDIANAMSKGLIYEKQGREGTDE
ncbi:MAG: type II toxin-antitoxin system death-on-curing family toxin [Bacteroidales bacterium]